MTAIEDRPLTEGGPDHAPHPAPIAAPQPADVLAAACVELGRLLDARDALLDGLDDATWRARPAPPAWAPVEIVCHLRDEEREDFGARVRVVVQGGARFAPIDPERWAVERRYRDQDPAQALQDLRTARAESLDFLDSIVPERLAAAVEHPALGRLSGLDLLVAWVTHDRLHLRQLAGTLARQWAARWAPLNAEYAGPIPYGLAARE